MSKDAKFLEEADRVIDSWISEFPEVRCQWSAENYMTKTSAYELINTAPQSWTIPSPEDVIRFNSALGIRTPLPRLPKDYNVESVGISATSLAIRFLETYPDIVSKVRKIDLIEEYMSRANSPSHARGLIPFCLLNRNLRFNRIVNIWGDALARYDWTTHCLMEPFGGLDQAAMTEALAPWFLETLALVERHGMPQGSYRLVLQGGPVMPRRLARIFRELHRNVAFNLAMERCYERGFLLRPVWSELRRRPGYYYERLPEMLKKLVNGEYSSLIECKFDTGIPCDPEPLVKGRERWGIDDWKRDWSKKYSKSYDIPDGGYYKDLGEVYL